MGIQKYLIDTNVAIEYVGGILPEAVLNKLDGIIDGQFSISVINKIEILGFSGLTEDEELKFNQFITAANVLNLDDAIVDTTIGLRKQFKTKLPDAIIAATALVNNLILFTRNTKDFDKIEGLVLNDPYCSSYRLLK